VQTGAIRIIGAISDGRSKYFPDVPTLAEQGFAEAQVTPWFGVVVPTGTPQPVVAKISAALEAALATSDGRQKLDTAGCAAKSAPPGLLANIVAWGVALGARVEKGGGIPADGGGTPPPRGGRREPGGGLGGIYDEFKYVPRHRRRRILGPIGARSSTKWLLKR